MPGLGTIGLVVIMNMGISVIVSAAAATRACSLGAPFSGTCFLGIFCGSVIPILSVLYLFHGSQTYLEDAFAFIPIGAFFGSLMGLGLAWVCKNQRAQLFFWLDSLSMAVQGILAVVATLCFYTHTNPVAILFIGLFCGLAPGMLRDVLLGDVALAIDRDWYAAALAIGCSTAMMVQIWLTEEFGVVGANIVSFLAGVLVTVLLRRIFGYRLAET